MNHDEATRYFDKLGEQVPDRRPPMPDLLAAGRVAERRRTRRALALGAVSVVLVAAAFALARGVLVNDEADMVSGGGSPVLTLPEWNSWPTAEVKGVLSLREGCLFVGDYAAVWASGSTWNQSERAVHYESLIIPVGDFVHGGGGYWTVGSSSGSVMGESTWKSAQHCARKAGQSEVVVVLPDSVRDVQDAMTITPTTAHPGDVVSLNFPTEQMRGVGYLLTARADGTIYELTSNAMQRDQEPTWSPEGSGWLDIGILGPGPDEILIPPVAAPGDYDLCTGNAAIEQCVTMTVTE